MALFHLLNLICWGISNVIMETVTIFTPYKKLSVWQSMRREFYSDKDCTKWWCLHFFRKNGLNELTGSLPVLESRTSQGTELEHAMLGKHRQGLFLAHLMAHLILGGSKENQIFLYRESLCLYWAGCSDLLRTCFSWKSQGPVGTFQTNF